MSRYISIETNIEVFEKYKALWAVRGIHGIMADSMTECIEIAMKIEKSNKSDLYFIAIVADDIDFMPQLRILSEQTDAPIFIATSKPDAVERKEAQNKGADYYGEYCETPELNIETVVSKIISIGRWTRKRPAKKPPLLLHNGVLLSPRRRVVFIKDKEVKLGNMEFQILRLLMSNCGNYLEAPQILRKVWGADYLDTDSENLYKAMNRLRNKLSEISPNKEYIKAERDIGYKFIE